MAVSLPSAHPGPVVHPPIIPRTERSTTLVPTSGQRSLAAPLIQCLPQTRKVCALFQSTHDAKAIKHLQMYHLGVYIEATTMAGYLAGKMAQYSKQVHLSQ